MGVVIALQIAVADSSSRVAVESVELVAGKGIVGDRNFGRPEDHAVREVTLVSQEGVAEYNAELSQAISPLQTLRNIVTEGVDLNTLVGRQFLIGSATLEGVEPCHPCAQLADELSSASVSPAAIVAGLMHRAGLRARVVRSGVVETGDTISTVETS